MGKRKDKKKFSSEVSENQPDDINEIAAPKENSAQSRKKKTKKKNLDNWDDEIDSDLALMNLNNKKDEDSEADDNSSSKNAADDLTFTKKGNMFKELSNWDELMDDEDDNEDVLANKKPDSVSTDKISNENKSQSKKSKKKKKDIDDNWEDDIEKELELIASGQAPIQEAEEETKKDSKAKNKKEKKKKNKQEESSSIAESQPNDVDNTTAPKDDSARSKKKKGKKNDLDNWEDDIEKELELIATGQAPTQEAGEETKKDSKAKAKKEKKKKKQEERRDKGDIKDVPSSSTGTQQKQTSQIVQDDSQQPTKDEIVTEALEESIQDKIEANESADVDNQAATEDGKKKKKKKKGKDEKEKKVDEKTKKSNKRIKMIQEAVRKRKEEEEKLRLEQEEKIRKEEEAIRLLEAAREEEKRQKELKKQAKKDRIEQLKKEGKYLTPAQREAQKRREAYLEMLKEQGMQIPPRAADSGTKRIRYENKKKQQKKPETKEVVKEEEEAPEVEEKSDEEDSSKIEEEPADVSVEKSESESEDDWEAMADKEEEKNQQKAPSDPVEDDTSSEEEESSSEESESDDVDEEEEEEELSAKEKARLRIQKLRETNERNRTPNNLRSPVICVMGHVDTGKTKILDKIRHTNVQDGEAGGITQQIGATNIPVQAIQEQTKMVQNFPNIRVPGLLVIDTPGHESFSNLRSRGSSNCDMAILVVDIMHGLEPQTIESINMLRKKKTPYIVALNKIDRLYKWKPNPKLDVVATIKQQDTFTIDEFKKRVDQIVVEFAQQELNVKLFYENNDPETWISMVPTSAHSGDGMGNLMACVVQHCQTRLTRRLAYSENLQCTVLEVKAILGLGTTVDVILTNGLLKYGDTIVLPGVEGPIVTHIKGLLMPQPLKELRVKNPYNHFKEVKAAQGVKVLAKDLDKALAGTTVLVAHHDDEIELLKEEVQAEVDQALKGIKLQDRGVFVQASTLGSLEALLEFLKQSKIPYAGINIGPVHKRDVMKASVMLEHDDQWAVILAFDVKVEREAQELADSLDVKIFTADIIYHLFDAFMKHREDLKIRKQDELRHLAIFPCKLKIVPGCVFKSRDPIVVGVSVEAGQLRVGTPICVPGKEFLNVGIVASIENNHKAVDLARKPQEVCIKIEGAQGEPPKMVGRHFDETDLLTSKISRESIDILKDWFRDEMIKSDWQLIVELKKLFEIM